MNRPLSHLSLCLSVIFASLSLAQPAGSEPGSTQGVKAMKSSDSPQAELPVRLRKPPVAHPERWMTIRVYGNILYTTGVWAKDGKVDPAKVRPLKPEDIDSWAKDCAEHGATAILWQSNCGGTSTHPSPVLVLSGPPVEVHNDAWKEGWITLGQDIRRFDTLVAGIAAAHKNGLRFVYSLCPWDLVGSPYEKSPFYPNLWMMPYEGEGFHGVPCYAEAEAVKLMLKHVRSVLDRGVDDLAISPFAHTQGMGEDKPSLYCYNPPVKEAYKKKYGVELTPETFDRTKWDALYGDFFTGFMRKLHHETSKRGQRLIGFTTRNGKLGWGGKGGKQFYDHNVLGAAEPTVDPGCGIEFQYKKWAEEGIVEGLLVVAPPDNAVEIAAEVRASTGKPVLLWQNATPGSTEAQWEAFRREATKVGAGKLDGYALHSMITVNYGDYPDHLWEVLRAAAGKGKVTLSASP